MKDKEKKSSTQKRLDRIEKSIEKLSNIVLDLSAEIDKNKKSSEVDLDHKVYSETRDGAIEEIIDNFDFHKMHDVMVHLDWKWYKRNEPPTVEELVDEAVDQLRKAFNHLDTMPFDHYGFRENFTGSGGFDVWVCEKNDGKTRFAELKFVVEEWRVEPLECDPADDPECKEMYDD